MNIMYCGDKNIEDGLIISVLSLLSNAGAQLTVSVLTLSLETVERIIEPVSQEVIDRLDAYMKKHDPGNSIRLIDMTEAFQREIPEANMETRFTPCCMLRLYSDESPEIPSRILYLDNDVVCRRGFREFYDMDMTGHEIAGVLDYYGRWFFHRRLRHMDYMNSGVLLINMDEVRKTGLFRKCREMCRKKQMFMPDQSALNKLCNTKIFVSRKYNEQRKLHRNTVFQHFTTSFRFFPWVHTISVKPWQIDEMHQTLQLHEYDDILNEYTAFKAAGKGFGDACL
jgi:lipopolysaccharide biosynthesis glycosyltransferase